MAGKTKRIDKDIIMNNFINSSIELYNTIHSLYNNPEVRPNAIYIKINNLMNRCNGLVNELNKTLTKEEKGINWISVIYNFILLEEIFNFAEVIRETHIKEYIGSNILRLTANILVCNIVRLAAEFEISIKGLKEPIDIQSKDEDNE